MKKRITFLFLAFLPLLPATATARINKPTSFIELRTQDNELQSHQYSCGAASLATLMTIFGRPTSEEELINDIFPSKNISIVNPNLLEIEPLSLKDLEDLARNREFNVVSLQAPDEQSSYNALVGLAPVITRIKVYGEILHFVVVKSVTNGWVMIGDPAYGNVRLPWSAFYSAFHEGERIFLSISTKPFLAKVDSSKGTLSVKRVDGNKASELADEIPSRLINAAKKTIRFNNSL